MAELTYAVIYQQALAQKYTSGVKFAKLYDPSGTDTNRFKFMGGNTIKIPKLSVTGMVDHNRDQVTAYSRKVDNSYETKVLSHDRDFDTLVDPADIDETNMALTIGNITRVFTTEELFPEMDKYMASKLYSEVATYGTINNDAVTTSAEVLNVFDKFMENMDEGDVPEDGRILYVTPAINTLLKNAVDRRFQNEPSINRIIASLDNVERVTVPSGKMKEVYDFTEGAVAGVGADQINMILVHPKSVIAPVKIDEIYIDEPSAKTKGKSLYFQRQYWDVFLLEERAVGCQINATIVA